jgi:hypothetical protein
VAFVGSKKKVEKFDAVETRQNWQNMNRNIPPAEAFSSNEGWQQMQILLDAHLPLKATTRQSTRRVIYCAAAIFICLLLCISLQLNTASSRLRTFDNTSSRQSTINQQAVIKNEQKQVGTTHLLPLGKNDYTGGQSKHNSVTENNGNSLPVAIETGFIDKHVYGIIETDSPKKQAGIAIEVQPVLIHPRQKNNLSKVAARPSWNLYAGTGLNFNLNSQQQLQPYPFAEVKYNLSQNFYLAIGLTALAPVSTIAGGVSKTVYLNDTVNNIRLYNEVTTYRRLQYADIPLSAGLYLTKHWSVSGGIQLSVLLNKQTQKVLEPYDYQMNNVTGLSLPIAVSTARAGQEYNVLPNKADYRYITGIAYSQSNVIVGLTYQHAFKPAANGPVSRHNNLVSLSLLFKIK